MHNYNYFQKKPKRYHVTSLNTHNRIIILFFSDNGGGQTKYLKWEDYFMAITLLAERRCKDICQTRVIYRLRETN